MNRRAFLRGAASLSTLAVSSRVAGFVSPAGAQQKEFVPRPGTWRTFEITTRVEILEPTGMTRAWLPIPSVKSDFQKPMGDQWTGNAKEARLLHVPAIRERRRAGATASTRTISNTRSPRAKSKHDRRISAGILTPVTMSTGAGRRSRRAGGVQPMLGGAPLRLVDTRGHCLCGPDSLHPLEGPGGDAAAHAQRSRGQDTKPRRLPWSSRPSELLGDVV